MDAEALISLIYKNKPIWDQKDPTHYNRFVIDSCWDNISATMNTTRDAVCKKWKSLRDTFRREFQKRPAILCDGSHGVWRSSWKHFDSLMFLHDQFTVRSASENLPTQDVIEQDHGRTSRKRTRPGDDLEQSLLQVEERKTGMFDKLIAASVPACDDDDQLFFKSYLPFVRSLPVLKKMAFRMKFQELLHDTISAVPPSLHTPISNPSSLRASSGLSNMSTDGEFHQLYMELREDPIKFQSYFRMNLKTFDYLLKKMEPRLMKKWTNFVRNPIVPVKRLTVTLRFLATGASFKSLGTTFKIGVSTVAGIVHETVEAIWDTLQPIHMPVPTLAMFNKISTDFYKKWNFPHCLGAIDGKHCRVKGPHQSGTIVLQAVSDCDCRFVAIELGAYGDQSDEDEFRQSSLFNFMTSDSVNIPPEGELPGTQVTAPFVFIGDEAYPLIEHLLKPYKTRGLTVEEGYFNERLSRARNAVECAFGIMNAKFQLLWKPIETSPMVADKIIRCICILHNMIIDLEGLEEKADIVTSLADYRSGRKGNRSTDRATFIRDVFKQYFCDNRLGTSMEEVQVEMIEVKIEADVEPDLYSSQPNREISLEVVKVECEDNEEGEHHQRLHFNNHQDYLSTYHDDMTYQDEQCSTANFIPTTRYMCDNDGCNKTFIQPSHLRRHQRAHHGDKPHMCDFDGCNKTFTHSSYLKRHQRTHTGDKPYVCEYDGCIKAFPHLSQLKRHQRTHWREANR